MADRDVPRGRGPARFLEAIENWRKGLFRNFASRPS